MNVIADEDFEFLIEAAMELNEYERPQAVKHSATVALASISGSDKPGDDFNSRADWEEILTPHGWKKTRSVGNKIYWQRPGKDGDGISATTGYCKNQKSGELFFCFSSNGAPFEECVGYSKFGTYALLNHNDDFVAAAKALNAKGWGKQYASLVIGETASATPAAPVLSASDSIPEGENIILRASEVTPKRMEWLWPGRIPLGKLVAFAGPGGIGKTMVLMDLVARITRGAEWPFAKGECANQGQCLYLSAEDEPDDTLVPRLIQCKADLSKVCFLKNAVLDYFTMADMKTLDRALRECGGDVRLAVFDPPTSFVGAVDDHKNAELRQLFGPLKSWAAKNKITIIFNTHINKSTSNPDAAGRVIGSVAWVNAPRAAYLFTRDADDPTRRLVSLFKQNLGPERPSMVYRIVTEETILGQQARVEWVEEVDTTADEALAKKPDKQTERVSKAIEFLVARFRQAKSWRSDDLMQRAKEEGISRNTLFEAKEALHMPKPRVETFESGNKWFYWWVPDNWEPLRNHEAGYDPPAFE